MKLTRPNSTFVRLSIAWLFFWPMLIQSASAQTNPLACLREHVRTAPESGSLTSDIQDMVEEIKAANATIRKIQVVKCPFRFSGKVIAFQAVGRGDVPDGEYIVYDDDWVREVIGDDRWLAFILAAHEIGHFVNGDFTPGVGNELMRPDQEVGADRYAACAFARKGGNWKALEGLLSRLRKETSTTDYKDRFTSVDEAAAAFEMCGGKIVVPNPCDGKYGRDLIECTAVRFWGMADAGNINELWLLTSESYRENFTKAFVSQQVTQTNVARGPVRQRVCVSSPVAIKSPAGKPLVSVQCLTNTTAGQYADDTMLEFQDDGNWQVMFFSSLQTEVIQ